MREGESVGCCGAERGTAVSFWQASNCSHSQQLHCPSCCPLRPPAHPSPLCPPHGAGDGYFRSGRIWGRRKWGKLANTGEFAIFLFNCTFSPASFSLSPFFVPSVLSFTPSCASSSVLFSVLTCASSSGFFCALLCALLCAFLCIGLNVFLHTLLPLGPVQKEARNLS